MNDIVEYAAGVPKNEGFPRRRAVVIGVSCIGERPSYTVRLLDSGVEKRTAGRSLSLLRAAPAPVARLNPPGGSVLRVCHLVAGSVTPATLGAALLAIRWVWPAPAPGGKPPHHDPHYRSYDNHYHHYYPRYHYLGGWGTVVVGGLGSLALVGVLVRKLGTQNGRLTFRWDRAWDRLLRMDIRELFMMASVLETALHYAGGLAGGRGGGGGGRRRRY